MIKLTRIQEREREGLEREILEREGLKGFVSA
jgi:hypothetical protein